MSLRAKNRRLARRVRTTSIITPCEIKYCTILAPKFFSKLVWEIRHKKLYRTSIFMCYIVSHNAYFTCLSRSAESATAAISLTPTTVPLHLITNVCQDFATVFAYLKVLPVSTRFMEISIRSFSERRNLRYPECHSDIEWRRSQSRSSHRSAPRARKKAMTHGCKEYKKVTLRVSRNLQLLRAGDRDKSLHSDRSERRVKLVFSSLFSLSPMSQIVGGMKAGNSTSSTAFRWTYRRGFPGTADGWLFFFGGGTRPRDVGNKGEKKWLSDPRKSVKVRRGPLLFRADAPRSYHEMREVCPCPVDTLGGWNAESGLFVHVVISMHYREGPRAAFSCHRSAMKRKGCDRGNCEWTSDKAHAFYESNEKGGRATV